MTHVSGIGGVFFRADEPAVVVKWYKDNLGIDIGGEAWWRQEEGPTVYAPFKTDTEYFGDPGQQFMINLRVADLDELIASLRERGVEVITNPDWNSDEIGKFARIHDPAGTPIELWEPAEGCA